MPLTHAATTTLVFPGYAFGTLPAWAERWAETERGTVLARHDATHHALPAIRAFETAHLILAHPGAVVVAEGLGATVLAHVLDTWPHLPLAAVLMVDPLDPARHPDLRMFPDLPDGPLPVPATLYLTATATARDRRLARHWDCLLAEIGGPETHTGMDEHHLPRLRSLRDQLARIGRPQEIAPPTPAPAARAALRPVPLPRILL